MNEFTFMSCQLAFVKISAFSPKKAFPASVSPCSQYINQVVIKQGICILEGVQLQTPTSGATQINTIIPIIFIAFIIECTSYFTGM